MEIAMFKAELAELVDRLIQSQGSSYEGPVKVTLDFLDDYTRHAVARALAEDTSVPSPPREIVVEVADLPPQLSLAAQQRLRVALTISGSRDDT